MKVEDTRKGAKATGKASESTAVHPSICALVNLVRLGGLPALNAYGRKVGLVKGNVKDANAEPRRRNYALLTGKPAPKAVSVDMLKAAYKAWMKANPKAVIPPISAGNTEPAKAPKGNGKAKAPKVEPTANGRGNGDGLRQVDLGKWGHGTFDESKHLLLLSRAGGNGQPEKFEHVKGITVTYMLASTDLDTFFARNLKRLAA